MYSHLEVYWELPQFARFMNRLAASARVLNFDRRGTGMSDRVVLSSALESRMDDVIAVMDAAGVERAAVYGWGEGSAAVAALHAGTHPDRRQHSSSTAGSRRAGLPTSPRASPLRIRTPTWPA